MSDLSDLELVAQAMQATEPQKKPTSSGPSTVNGHSTTQSTDVPPAETNSQTTALQPASIPGIDPELLASLSVEDRQLLLPIINALEQADGLGDGDEDVGDILKQMDVAEGVADELEGKLDRLIQALGAEEKGLKEELPVGKEAYTGQRES